MGHHGINPSGLREIFGTKYDSYCVWFHIQVLQIRVSVWVYWILPRSHQWWKSILKAYFDSTIKFHSFDEKLSNCSKLGEQDLSALRTCYRAWNYRRPLPKLPPPECLQNHLKYLHRSLHNKQQTFHRWLVQCKATQRKYNILPHIWQGYPAVYW